MDTITTVAQIIIALGIYNVWFIRYDKDTSWRGGDATNMNEEFAHYGLPQYLVYVVGFFKLTFATMLVFGLYYSNLVKPAAVGMAILMAFAIAMHLKSRDPLRKSLPASSILMLSILVAAQS